MQFAGAAEGEFGCTRHCSLRVPWMRQTNARAKATGRNRYSCSDHRQLLGTRTARMSRRWIEWRQAVRWTQWVYPGGAVCPDDGKISDGSSRFIQGVVPRNVLRWLLRPTYPTRGCNRKPETPTSGIATCLL